MNKKNFFKIYLKSFFSFSFFILFFFIFTCSVSAATYYVAGDIGNDTTGDGSNSTPWKTIQKAADTMVAGDTANVKGGLTYTETSGSNGVTPANSGTSGSQITYQAWSGTGTPIVTTNASSGFVFYIPAKDYITIKGFDLNVTVTNGYGIVLTSNNDGIIIANNIIRATVSVSTGRGIYHGGQGHNIKIYNNTISGTFGYGLHLVTLGPGAGWTCDVGGDYYVKNNIVNGAVKGVRIASPTNLTFSNCYDEDYNDFYNTTNYELSSGGAHDILVDPLFVDSSSNDYHINTSSPSKNTGTTLSETSLDILGVARPQGSAYDIGAYEYYEIPITLTTIPTTPSSNTTPTIIGNSSTISGATISSVSYSVDSGSWSTSGVTGTDSFTIIVPTLADGSHTVRVRATDSYNNVSDSTLYGSTTFTIDTTAPTSNSISINSGTTYSTSRTTTLTLSSTGASLMMISEDSGFSGTSWETYSTSKSFELSTGDGTKEVYAKFKDESGNSSSSVSDSIVLDTINPILGSFVTPRDYTKDSNKPTLTFKKATDSTSGISAYSVSLDSGKNKNYSTSGIPSVGDITKSSYIWKDDNNVRVEFYNESDSDSTNDEVLIYFKDLDNSELTEGKHSWKVIVTDLAGNENSSTQDFYLDKTSPNISELSIANVSTVKQGQVYTLSIFKRTPSFSGKIEDPLLGSEKTNNDGSKDTFDKISSGADNINLSIKKFDGKKYINHFTKDYSVTSNRFYITTPFPLVDGQYEVLITAKDKAGNTNSHPTFYLSIGNSSIFSTVTSLISDLLNNKQDNQPSPSISQKSQMGTLKINNQNRQNLLPKSRNFFSWFINLFRSIFQK